MINPIADFTSAQLTKLDKMYATFVPEEMVAGSDELFYYIKNKLFSSLDPEENPSVRTITLDELIGLDRNEVATQSPIEPSKVFRLLAGEDSLLELGLVNPVKIGLIDGKPYNEGGGHRAEALRLIFEHYGFAARLDEVEVPCFSLKGMPQRIILDNVARGATKYERTLIHTSADGLNVNDRIDVYEAYLDGELKLADATIILSVKETDGNDAGLTAETRQAVAVSFVNMVKKEYGKEQFTLSDSFLADLISFYAEHIEGAVKYVSKTTTLIARAVKPMATYIFGQFKDAVEAKEFEIKEKPVKTPKPKTPHQPKVAAPKATQVEGEPTTAKKPRKPRAKKNVEVVPEEGVAEPVVV